MVNKKIKHWNKEQTYYICAIAENQFVIGLVKGGRISPGIWSDIADVYFDFEFFEKSEDDYTFMKEFKNTSEFIDTNNIDYSGVDTNSMWSVNYKDIKQLPKNVYSQVIKDIMEKL